MRTTTKLLIQAGDTVYPKACCQASAEGFLSGRLVRMACDAHRGTVAGEPIGAAGHFCGFERERWKKRRDRGIRHFMFALDWRITFALGLIIFGCVHQTPSPATPTPVATAAEATPPAQTQAASREQQALAGSDEAMPPPTSPGIDPTQLPESERRAMSLPEIRVENVGLHIGGGPNTAEAKQTFLRAVARHFKSFRMCYVYSEDPTQGGVFGADLYIPRGGGHPEVRQPRTGMAGARLRNCMVDAFKQVEFERPGKPTVISYSLRFVYRDSTAAD